MTREVVAVIVLNSQNEFVILKRSKDKKVHANLWNLPSGGIEEDESIEQTSKREVGEETGLTVSELQVGPSETIEIPNGRLKINYVLGKTNSSRVEINEENSEYRWVTPEDSLDYEFAVPKETVIRILKKFGLL